MKGSPHAAKGKKRKPANVVGHSVLLHSKKEGEHSVHVHSSNQSTRKAKAAASRTNRGAVARGEKTRTQVQRVKAGGVPPGDSCVCLTAYRLRQDIVPRAFTARRINDLPLGGHPAVRQTTEAPASGGRGSERTQGLERPAATSPVPLSPWPSPLRVSSPLRVRVFCRVDLSRRSHSPSRQHRPADGCTGSAWLPIRFCLRS